MPGGRVQGSRVRNVALIYDATRVYDLKVMTGVAAYIREGAPWSVYIEETALKDQHLPDLKSWHGDGIIANLDDPNVVKAVLASHLPTVAFGSGYGWYDPAFRIPYFFTNNQGIARLAADHLLERGFRHFAYYGGAQTRITGWSVERERAFAKHIKDKGYRCHIHRDRRGAAQKVSSLTRTLGAWLVALPKPVGLMGDNDQRARLVLEACRTVGLRVPEQVAVVGVDNDELLCQLSTPPLSSVEQGSRRIGYEAAACLDQIMAGRKRHPRSRVLDPTGVVARGSTDILAIDDHKVAEAMRFASEHACEGIQAQDVADAIGASRSGLDARFRSALGRTIRVAIRSVQMERAVRLLPNTTLSLKEIASRTGFKSVQHMTTLFGQTYGCPPGKYRRTVNHFQAL
jgi:LacI family transcriptional regulator